MSMPATSIKRLPAFPTELWRSIFRWTTIESSCPFSPRSSVSFGWPYNPTFDTPFFRSLATKRNLVLVSHRFSEVASELLYETLHFRRASQAILLAQLCCEDHKLAVNLRSWTKSLCITPVFNPVTTEEEVEKATIFLRSVLDITKRCSQLRSVLVQVDSVTLFREPTYQPWVEILGVLPSELEDLAIENFLLGPVVWEPPLFGAWETASNLRTLHLDADHPPFKFNFPRLMHLWLFSWATASKWDMPSLSHLYIGYFPGNDSTSTFWTQPKPQLKLLHFGGDTDFGLYFRDLPQLLQECTPNLQGLEYHYSGDLDILWEPDKLPRSLQRVTVRLEDCEGRRVELSLTSQDVLLHYTAAGFDILLELLTELCPAASHRWIRVERHLEKYNSHPAKLFAFLPRRAASLLQLDDHPPLILSSRVPTITDTEL